MESVEDAMKFGRQPEPVSVTIVGHTLDIDYWLRELMRRAEFKGDMVQRTGADTFRIYPRAVND